MYSIEPCVLIPYFELDDLLVLVRVNNQWKTWVENNLNTLALQYGLPVISSCFIDLYNTSFWSANDLLKYATKNQNTRLIAEANKRYACSIYNAAFSNCNEINEEFKTHSLKKFKQYVATLSESDLKRHIVDVLYVHSKCLSYEIAIYILETYKSKDYYITPEFIEFCEEHNLYDLIADAIDNNIYIVMDHTGCTKEEAIIALKHGNGDVVNAIMRIIVTI